VSLGDAVRARVPEALFAAWLVLWIALAIEPVYRADWLLENLLVFVAVPVLVLTRARVRFSNAAYACLAVFFSLHAIGAHYTYSLVPYDELSRRLCGRSLNEALGFERNHYDRLVHFCYGLCFAYPIRELFLRVANVKGVWGYLLPLDVTMSTSMIYEMIEWGAAVVFGGELGQSYLGTQGDEWDAHWDMALATLGAAVTIAITFGVNAALRRDFARELAESLRVKHPEPLGEAELDRMLDEREEVAG
jgi:putative membrane protein